MPASSDRIKGKRVVISARCGGNSDVCVWLTQYGSFALPIPVPARLTPTQTNRSGGTTHLRVHSVRDDAPRFLFGNRRLRFSHDPSPDDLPVLRVGHGDYRCLADVRVRR